MITEYVRYVVPEHQREAFEAAYARAARSLTASPACVDFVLDRCTDLQPDESPTYIMQIHWTSVDAHLAQFRTSAQFESFIAEVGPFVDDIVEMRHYQPTGVRGVGRGLDPDVPTLYDWAGGQPVWDALFVRFYELVADDDLIGPLFASMDPNHPTWVAAWMAEVMGGPARYSDDRGGYPSMLRHHLGLGITEAQRRRWVSLLLDAADETDLPTDPEFRAALVGYLEWGTRIAVENSQPDARPATSAPVPRWGWGVAPPWQG